MIAIVIYKPVQKQHTTLFPIIMCAANMTNFVMRYVCFIYWLFI